MPVSDSTPEGIPLRLLEWFLSAVGGALVTVVAFGTKLAISNRRHDEQDKRIDEQKTALSDAAAELRADLAEALAEHKEMIANHRNDITAEAIRAERAFRESLEAMRRETDKRHEENVAQLRFVKRQQFLTLKMIADIARHSGADKRFDDAIWSALAAENEEE